MGWRFLSVALRRVFSRKQCMADVLHAELSSQGEAGRHTGDVGATWRLRGTAGAPERPAPEAPVAGSNGDTHTQRRELREGAQLNFERVGENLNLTKAQGGKTDFLNFSRFLGFWSFLKFGISSAWLLRGKGLVRVSLCYTQPMKTPNAVYGACSEQYTC